MQVSRCLFDIRHGRAITIVSDPIHKEPIYESRDYDRNNPWMAIMKSMQNLHKLSLQTYGIHSIIIIIIIPHDHIITWDAKK